MERKPVEWIQVMLERPEMVNQLQTCQKAYRMIEQRNRRTGFITKLIDLEFGILAFISVIIRSNYFSYGFSRLIT